MDLHYLKLFNTLASELSFSKAANALYISQPAVSIQIKKLENDLGLKLFDKLGKNIYLNENGKLLYEYTKKIFELVDEAQSQLYSRNGVIKGTVKIGASNTPGTYILPHILGEFREMCPMVNTNLHIANTHEIEKLILDNKVDFAVNGGNIPYGSQIYVEKLTDDEIILVASPSNRLSDRQYIECRDLLNAKYVTHERDSKVYKMLEDLLNELELPFNITMTLGNIDAIKQAVSADLGISAIPKSACLMEWKYGLLKQLKIRDKSWTYPYNLIYYKNRYLSAPVLKLMDLVRLRMKNLRCR